MKSEESFKIDTENPKFVIFERKQWIPIKKEDCEKGDRSIEEQIKDIDVAISRAHDDLKDLNTILEPVKMDERLRSLKEQLDKLSLYKEQKARLSNKDVVENLKTKKDMMESDIKSFKKRMAELKKFVPKGGV